MTIGEFSKSVYMENDSVTKLGQPQPEKTNWNEDE